MVDARLVHKIYRSIAPGLPVSVYDDLSAFMIYLADVGLLRRLAQLAPTAFGEGNHLFTEFKGLLFIADLISLCFKKPYEGFFTYCINIMAVLFVIYTHYILTFYGGYIIIFI